MAQNYVPYDSTIFNSEVQVNRKGQEIVMTGKSCEVLKSEAASIKTWSKKTVPKGKQALCKCTAGLCSLNITQIVPDLVHEMQGVCPANSGPNCLNTTLVSTGLVNNLRYTNTKEMNFWLGSPLCKERLPGEEKKPGDVVIFLENGIEMHAFVHVTKNLSFARNGSSKFPYTFQSPENGYEAYGVKKGCEDIYKTPDASKNCKVWTNTYSCVSFEDYAKKNPITNSEQLKTLKLLEANECSLSGEAFATSINSSVLDVAKISLLSIRDLAERRVKSSTTPEDKMIWKSIMVKADASYEQYLLLYYSN